MVQAKFQANVKALSRTAKPQEEVLQCSQGMLWCRPYGQHIKLLNHHLLMWMPDLHAMQDAVNLDDWPPPLTCICSGGRSVPCSPRPKGAFARARLMGRKSRSLLDPVSVNSPDMMRSSSALGTAFELIGVLPLGLGLVPLRGVCWLLLLSGMSAPLPSLQETACRARWRLLDL